MYKVEVEELELFQSWSIRDAKSKLSELIDKAQSGMPQLITNHGQPKALLLKVGSADEIRELLALRKELRRRALLESLSLLRKAAEEEGVEKIGAGREDGRPLLIDEGLE